MKKIIVLLIGIASLTTIDIKAQTATASAAGDGPGSVSISDFNNDGFSDIVAVNRFVLTDTEPCY